MNLYDSRKMKWRARVEWINNFGMENPGWYVILKLNDYDVYSWKTTKFDERQLFEHGDNPNLTEEENRMSKTVDQEGLDQFIADSVSELFALATSMNQVGL